MAALDPLGRRRRESGGRVMRRRCAALAVVIATSALLPAVPGGAAAVEPGKPKDLQKEYAKLKKRADALNKEYRGELISLDQAKKAAERAGLEAGRLTREFDTARADLSRFAASTYMSGRLDAIPLVTSGDPQAIRDMTMVEHISRNTGRKIQSLETLANQATKSQQTARAKLADVEKEIKDLESQRSRVKKLLAKYKPEVPAAPGRPDGAPKTKSPLIGPSMTSRMRTLMVAIDGRFGPFPAIGCSRPGDPQDHGSGRACDFMESTGGNMPSSGARAHGDAVAQFVISNASRYGVKYVIWRQRIYDMRGSGGWKSMSDRGSITANHYDHVHVSVL